MQRGGAFKFRGAYNAVASLSEKDLSRGVVASSSGNHAQALAIAARLAGTEATILMPQDAPTSKRAATESYGARVIEFDRYVDDREEIVAELVEHDGLTPVHPYDDPRDHGRRGDIHARAARAGRPARPGDHPGRWWRAARPAVRSPLRARPNGPAWSASRRPRSGSGGRRWTPDGPLASRSEKTIADGQQLAAPGELTFAVVKELAEDVVGVTDDEIRSAMAHLFERQKLVVEPSGASALAAVLSGRIDVGGLRVGIVLSGGNIAVDRFVSLLADAR